MKTMMLLLISLLLCAGCSPSKRLSRLLERHSELKTADTVTVRDTLVEPEVSADTALPLAHIPDTVIVEKGRLEVLVRKMHDTLFVSGKCKADTIIVEKKIPVEKIIVTKSRNRWYLWCVLGLLAGMVVVILIRRA